MGTFVFNIAKGRVAELYHRVQTNDPGTSGIKVVPVERGATTDATLMDLDTLSDVLAQVTERTTGGWNRKTLTDADLTALTVNDGSDLMPVDVGDQTWTTVTVGTVSDLLFVYFPDTGGADSTAIPLTCHAFAITPDGSNVVATINNFYQAA